MGLVLAMARFGLIDWHLLHVLHLPTRSLQAVSTLPDFSRWGHAMLLGKPTFASNGSLLLAPWSRHAP